ncbi:MAG: copper chaperone, partial [Gammaproteobacteria bacterium]
MSKIIIDIDGMSCGHCTAAVERALSAVPGVSAVRVTLKPGQAEVEGE